MATQIKKSNQPLLEEDLGSWVSRDDLHKGDPYAPLLESKKQNQVEIIKEG